MSGSSAVTVLAGVRSPAVSHARERSSRLSVVKPQLKRSGLVTVRSKNLEIVAFDAMLPKPAGTGSQDVQIRDVFPATGEHDRQRAQDRAWPVARCGRDGLAQTVLAQAWTPSASTKDVSRFSPA
ncbi:hypothetical protein AB0O52_18315 [Arthrobacter sp. NPDC080073]|uniref:hypothetical protein n=1 Tax=Arthrobacter sp. NPDC080073 TaxID=3155919 RepID=UPI0034392938